MSEVFYPHEYIATLFSFQNYVLLDRYMHSKTKMRVQCPKGHITSLSCGSFRDGHRCMTCGHERQAVANSRQIGSKNHQWNPDREQVRQNKEAYQHTHNLAIDHIFPVKAFLDHGIKNPAIISALSNLQPLSKSENSEKHDFYNKEAFEQYCQEHNILLGGVHG